MSQFIPDNYPREGEVSLKTWRIQQGQRLGVSEISIAQYLHRGTMPYPKQIRRVNKRVIFVLQQVQDETQQPPANEKGKYGK